MTTTEINFYAIIDKRASTSPPKERIYYTNPNVAIVFGSFTMKECSEAQGVPEPTTSTSTIGTQTSNHLLSNFPVPPTFYLRQPVPCTRCGHLGHNIERCVAKRNIHGEFIKQPPSSPDKFKMYPPSPPTSPSRGGDTHYYNTHLFHGWCESDKTDYNEFVFTQDEVEDWIDEQHELFVPPLPSVPSDPAQVVYVPFLIRNQTRYAQVMIPSADQEVDYILRYNYSMSDYMLGRQASYAY